jgi:sigma-B regulation protein RsbU (phosphoserine phosphatase)
VEVLHSNGARPGSALGVFEHAEYATYQRVVSPGDLVLMFTDGILEVEGADGDYFDQQRLIAAIERRADMPSDGLLDALLTETREYAYKHQFGDDVCLVGVELRRLLQGVLVDGNAPTA